MKTRNTSHCSNCGTDLRYADELVVRESEDAVIALCLDRCEDEWDEGEGL